MSGFCSGYRAGASAIFSIWAFCCAALLTRSDEQKIGIVVGVLLAIVAVLSWRLQQAWHRRLERNWKPANEVERREKMLSALRAHHKALLDQAIAQRAQPNSPQFSELITEFLRWMDSRNLRHYANNWLVYNNWNGRDPVKYAVVGPSKQMRVPIGEKEEEPAKLLADIQTIQLPPITDSAFTW